MKINLKTIGLLAFVLMLSITACKKDEDPQPTTTDYLTTGTWKQTAVTVNPGIDFGNGVIITDFYSTMEACSKDDLITFNLNGTITDDEGATKCDPDDPQIYNEGTWVLSMDNTKLTINYDDEPIVLSIVTINNTTLNGTYILEDEFGEGTSTSYTFTITFAKQ